MVENDKEKNPYLSILDETNQMIQISDCETMEMLYANKPAARFAANAEKPYIGEKCYKYMMDLDEQCPFCPILQLDGRDSYVTEIDNGIQVFTVKTQLIEWNGRKSFIEYATDVTLIKRAQDLYKSEIRRLLTSIAEAQGIFHLNVTRDTCISAHGASNYVNGLMESKRIDELIENSKQLIQDKDQQQRYVVLFCRDALIAAYNAGKTELVAEAEFLMDSGEIHWARTTARLMTNPNTGDLECILYGIDINDEVKYRNSMELAIRNYQRLKAEANKDVLTGVYSKKAFEQMGKQLLAQSGNMGSALLFIDIDDFKRVNDTIGHLPGDYVIIDVARKLQSAFDEENIVSRFGGDEFCVLIIGIKREQLFKKLEWLIKRLRGTYRNEEKSVNLTCSIGAAYNGGNGLVEMMELADKALYQAKAEGRDRFVVYG